MLRAHDIATHVGEMVGESATIVRPDLLVAFERAHGTERSDRGRWVLSQLIENADIARRDDVPICQDTGTVWVRIELGAGVQIEGDLATEIDAAVERAYRLGGLRMSVVHDALIDRTNTRTNTPVFVEVVHGVGEGATVYVMLKGAGSDNASRLEMLSPDEGFDGVARVVLDVVERKGSVACPPLVIGVGVGSTFDRVAGLAKHALLRPVGEPNPNPALAALEASLLARVNATGIGPGGLGGDVTALAVHLETAPCHIAALPVAVNLGCSASRWRVRHLDSAGAAIASAESGRG